MPTVLSHDEASQAPHNLVVSAVTDELGGERHGGVLDRAVADSGGVGKDLVEVVEGFRDPSDTQR